jgi:predicted transcriptional regulator
MGTQIYTYVDDDFAEDLEELADKLDMSRSKLVGELVRDGLAARNQKLALAQTQAKLDVLLEGFGEAENASDRVEDYLREADVNGDSSTRDKDWPPIAGVDDVEVGVGVGVNEPSDSNSE